MNIVNIDEQLIISIMSILLFVFYGFFNLFTGIFMLSPAIAHFLYPLSNTYIYRMQIIHVLQDWWQHQTWLEVIGVITGLLCVYLAAINNIWNWPFAVISVTIYIFIFFEAKLFADVGLQFYFFVVNLYGWYYWSQKPATEKKVPVARITRKEIVLAVPAVIIFTVILGSLLKYTTASYPYIDSFCTACSLVAQFFLARKVLENWLIWIFVDVIYVGVYTYKDLHLTAIMYAIYVAIAIKGYVDWKKDATQSPNGGVKTDPE